MKELPKTGAIFYQITINKGIVTKSNPMTVKDEDNFYLCSYEFTDGNNRFDVKKLYPCNICGGPNNAPLGMGYWAFIYALEKDAEEATKFLVDQYSQACLDAAKEADDYANTLRHYFDISKGEHK